jgi:hypothetical protein
MQDKIMLMITMVQVLKYTLDGLPLLFVDYINIFSEYQYHNRVHSINICRSQMYVTYIELNLLFS